MSFRDQEKVDAAGVTPPAATRVSYRVNDCIPKKVFEPSSRRAGQKPFTSILGPIGFKHIGLVWSWPNSC